MLLHNKQHFHSEFYTDMKSQRIDEKHDNLSGTCFIYKIF